jgi:hypothetical protein
MLIYSSIQKKFSPKINQLNVCIFLFSTAVKKICDIYDWDGKGELDMFFLGDVMYALGMNTTKKVSQENPPGSKKLPSPRFYPSVKKIRQVLKSYLTTFSYPSVKKIRHVLKAYLSTFFPCSQENPPGSKN